MGILSDAEKIRKHPLWQFYCDCEALDGDSWKEDIEIATYYVAQILQTKMDYYSRQLAIKMLYEFFPFEVKGWRERPSIIDFYCWKEKQSKSI